MGKRQNNPCRVCSGPMRGDKERTVVDDPFYVGTPGHCPPGVCFDCWCIEWDTMEARMLNGGEWTTLDEALWLVSRGLTRSEAAAVVGTSRRTLYRWLQKLRKNTHLIPDWLSQKGASRVRQ